MADEREGQGLGKNPANEDKIQTAGRKANDAQPLHAAEDDGGPERYPSVRQDDAIERTGRAQEVIGQDGESRSFDPKSDIRTPTKEAGEAPAPEPTNEGKVGPGGKPAQGDDIEGKR